jgi:hypothetical protein
MSTIDQIEAFATFAKNQLGSGQECSIDDLYHQWREAFKKGLQRVSDNPGEFGFAPEDKLTHFEFGQALCVLRVAEQTPRHTFLS